MKITRIIWICIWICGTSIFIMEENRDHSFFPVGLVYAQEDWRKEFDDLCSVTPDVTVSPSNE